MDQSWNGKGFEDQLRQQLRPTEPEADEDSDGDWRHSRHQLFALQVVDDDGTFWVLPYGNIGFQRLGKPGLVTIRLQDADGARWDLVLKGDSGNREGFDRLLRQLCAGKREQIRPKPGLIASVRFVEVEEED